MLIETSGIGDPVPIVHTLLTDPFLRERFCLGGTITTIDALQPLTALCRHAEGLRQAAVADLRAQLQASALGGLAALGRIPPACSRSY